MYQCGIDKVNEVIIQCGGGGSRGLSTIPSHLNERDGENKHQYNNTTIGFDKKLNKMKRG